MRCLDFRQECCHGSQCWLTQLVVQDLTEWLWDVATEKKDDTWSKDVVQILVFRDCTEHRLKASAAAAVLMACAQPHHFSLVVHQLYLGLQKLNPERHKDELRRLYILTPVRNRILREAHHAAVGGHSGAAEKYVAVRYCFLWPGILKGFQDCTKGCDMCARVNHWAGKVVGLLKPLPVVQGRWKCVGAHFITDVPISLRENDRIVTFVDHFCKWAHWIPCTKTIDAVEFAQLFLEAIIWLHGVPRYIGSYRDAHSTLDFWVDVSKTS